MIASNDGGFLVAGCTSPDPRHHDDMCLIKVNAQGQLQWTHSYVGSIHGDEAYSIIPASDSGYVLAGMMDPNGNGLFDMSLLKVNAQGDSLWMHSYDFGNADWILSAVPAGDGGYLLAGCISMSLFNYNMGLIKVDAQGHLLWVQNYGGSGDEWANDIVSSGDGGFMLDGTTNSYGAGLHDMWLVKINGQGDTLWTRTYGGLGWEEANSIIPTEDGNFLLAGGTTSPGVSECNIYLVKINAHGDTLWTRSYPRPASDEIANAIIPSGDGNYLLTGAINPPGQYNQGNALLMKVEGSSTLSPDLSRIPLESADNPTSHRQVNAKAFNLHSPHPNPFNLTTTFSFALSSASLVMLKVYDVSGRLVATLVEGWREAGDHEVTFDGSTLASGVYLVKLTSGGETSLQKVMLLK
jgi:hypothetical protein